MGMILPVVFFYIYQKFYAQEKNKENKKCLALFPTA
jgi:hypothetical protein